MRFFIQVLTAPINLDDDDTFAKFQTRIAARCRAILAANSDITMAANNRPGELGELAQKLTDEYTSLAGDGAGLAAIADSDEVSCALNKRLSLYTCVDFKGVRTHQEDDRSSRGSVQNPCNVVWRSARSSPGF